MIVLKRSEQIVNRLLFNTENLSYGEIGLIKTTALALGLLAGSFLPRKIKKYRVPLFILLLIGSVYMVLRFVSHKYEEDSDEDYEDNYDQEYDDYQETVSAYGQVNDAHHSEDYVEDLEDDEDFYADLFEITDSSKSTKEKYSFDETDLLDDLPSSARSSKYTEIYQSLVKQTDLSVAAINEGSYISGVSFEEAADEAISDVDLEAEDNEVEIADLVEEAHLDQEELLSSTLITDGLIIDEDQDHNQESGEPEEEPEFLVN